MKVSIKPVPKQDNEFTLTVSGLTRGKLFALQMILEKAKEFQQTVSAPFTALQQEVFDTLSPVLKQFNKE